MAYKVFEQLFKAPNGVERVFGVRSGTCDYNVVTACFHEDEYGLSNVGLKAGDVVIDAGAHIGSFTILAMALCDNLRIFSFEPDPNNFRLLHDNVARIDYGDEVNLFRQALWFHDDDTVKVYKGNNTPVGREHKFIDSLFHGNEYLNKVPSFKANTMSLDKLFEENNIKECRLLKIDVEGSEYAILEGASLKTLEAIQEIRGEYHKIGERSAAGPRKLLMEFTRGAFKDISEGADNTDVGSFHFVRE